MWQYNYTDELYHYGVKGMKWGARRAASSDSVAAKNIRKKKVKEMSNQELKTANERMNLEKNYKDMSKKTKVGRKVVTGFIAGGLAAAGITKAVTAYSKLGKEAFKGFDKIKKLSTVAINAKKDGVATKTIARAAGTAFKMNYLK